MPFNIYCSSFPTRYKPKRRIEYTWVCKTMSPALLMPPSSTHTHSFDCNAVTTATTDRGILLHCRPGQTSAVQRTRSSAASTCSTSSLIPEPNSLCTYLPPSCWAAWHSSTGSIALTASEVENGLSEGAQGLRSTSRLLSWSKTVTGSHLAEGWVFLLNGEELINQIKFPISLSLQT